MHIDSRREGERLAALRSYRILDSLPDEGFDELTGLASITCATPIALVSLVDESRQWFKSRVGLEATETPRELAFCAHAIWRPTTMVVPDATRDDRFRDNPLVTGPPDIRFYAGAPLQDGDGHALGTLCVIDHEPRALSDQQLRTLATLSRQVVRLMELHRSKQELVELLDRASELARLRRICSHCHAVHTEPDGWRPIAHYLRDAAGMQLSHGVCPACMVEHYR